jgi:hypothetical protein
MARRADTYEAGKGIITFIGDDLVSVLDSLKAGVEHLEEALLQGRFTNYLKTVVLGYHRRR